jgi:hypothetical protein
MEHAPAVIGFVLASVAQVIVTLFTAAYAAQCLLVIIENTAAGADDIDWPGEPFLDYLWKFIYLAWLAAFWLVPAWGLLRILGRLAHWTVPALAYVVVMAGAFCFFFPVSLLSSLSAHSKWAVLSPALLKRLAGRLPALVIYYFVSAMLLAGWLALFYGALAFERGRAILLILAAFAAATALFVNARLLGRVAMLLSSRAGSRKRRRKRRLVSPVAEAVEEAEEPPPKGARAESPATASEEDERFSEEDEGGVYEMTDAIPPPSPQEQPLPLPEAYQLAKEEPPPRAQVMETDSAAAGEGAPPPPSRERPSQRIVYQAPPPPTRPLLQGVYTFPWYPSIVVRWVVLSLCFLVVGFLLRVQLLLLPS